jgi:hypothetical protein
METFKRTIRTIRAARMESIIEWLDRIKAETSESSTRLSYPINSFISLFTTMYLTAHNFSVCPLQFVSSEFNIESFEYPGILGTIRGSFGRGFSEIRKLENEPARHIPRSDSRLNNHRSLQSTPGEARMMD